VLAAVLVAGSDLLLVPGRTHSGHPALCAHLIGFDDLTMKVVDASAKSATGDPVELPYGPFLTRTLPTLSRSFRVLNRCYVLPVIKLGLGRLHANPLTGSWLLLRTTGRRTGRKREVALGYAILDGAVYCSAGFGPRTRWYRNLLADPRVEVVLPDVAFAGLAEEVSDPAELDRAWRVLIQSLGILGRAFVCAPDVDPDELKARTANLPLVRIRPVGLASGPADPGGWLWITLTLVGLVWLAGRVRSRGSEIARVNQSLPTGPSRGERRSG